MHQLVCCRPFPLCRRYASTLLRRLEQTHAAHATVHGLLPSVPAATEVLSTYELTHQAVQQFIVTTHTEWFAMIEPSLSKALAVPLLVQDRSDRERCPRTQRACPASAAARLQLDCATLTAPLRAVKPLQARAVAPAAGCGR